MDLNRLYFEHGLALLRASSADGPQARARHCVKADNIRRRIVHLRQRAAA